MLDLIDVLKAHHLPVNTSHKQLKIHLASHDGHVDPLDVFRAGNFQAWQQNQSRQFFNCDQAIGLIKYDSAGTKYTWLFAGICRIIGVKPHPQNPGNWLYSTELLPSQDDLIGRVVVHYQRSGQASYLWYTDDMKLPIHEIRAKQVSIKEFTGFANVLLMHNDLKAIMQHPATEWKMALSHTKGIYVITDTQSGQHYVGQAAGAGGFWQRWSDYATTGHGHNV